MDEKKRQRLKQNKTKQIYLTDQWERILGILKLTQTKQEHCSQTSDASQHHNIVKQRSRYPDEPGKRDTLVLLELKSTWKLSSKSNENAWQRVLQTADCIEKLLVETVGRRKVHSGILGRKTTKTPQMN